MFAVEVRESIMVAHSLPDSFFGPAANKHGATFVVDVAFLGPALSRHNVVVDIGRAQAVLKAVLAPLHYQDLDVLPQFAGVLTTTEFLCRHIHHEICAAIRRGELGDGAEALSGIRVTLGETPLARAWYEAALSGA
ncbi:6-pyruvoyl trahydropterin synthase family protein [Rhodopila sp.]|uniref:6-pyruvoyl trahydropterin synthase family protein n=1 Tax=Rhodopila sp. TaxID=2480087 RepID=UPI002BD966D8|nr:6-carboxytetrahydropterin synthase [Rhodopila sp.]HVZ07325.1 6-carboxytetrahydropterin synthase [Rhodopila sp.]